MTKIPSKLTKGDTVAIIAPSRGVFGYEKEIEGGVDFLTQQGFNVIKGKSCSENYYGNAGRAQLRAKEINDLFSDTKVRAIFCALGGDAAIQTLPWLDFELIKNNPKIFMGFSDITTLLLPLYKKSSLMTIHGPNVKNLLNLDKESKQFLTEILTGTNAVVDYPIKEATIIREGKAKGRLIGGNLFVINSLAATGYKPDFDGAILFFEDIDENLAAFDYQINLLKLTGILDQISGLIIGEVAGRNIDNRKIEDITLELTNGKSYPVIKVNFFGHNTNNFLPMPIGVDAFLSTTDSKFELTFAK